MDSNSATAEACRKDGEDALGAVFEEPGDVEALGRKVYVKFVYADPAGINDIRRNSSDSKVVARYNLNGQRVSSAQQGINVVRLQNGKVIKYLQR